MRISLNDAENFHESRQVLLTVPHARCLSSDNRLHRCDTRSQALQESLQSHLNERHIVTDVVVGDINRSQCDLNRSGACNQNSYFKRRVLVSLNDDRTALLLDCHSFPDSMRPGIEVYFIEYIPANVRLSTTPAHELYEFLHARDVATIDTLVTTGIDDLIILARKKHVPAILIELNEMVSDERLDLISAYIAEWTAQRIVPSKMKLNALPSLGADQREWASDNWAIESYRLDYMARREKCEAWSQLPASEFVYEQVRLEECNQVVTIVRDDLLCGGTKTRIIHEMLSDCVKRGASILVYPSTYIGSAQIVLARGISEWNASNNWQFQCIVFNMRDGADKPYPRLAQEAGAQMHFIDTDDQRVVVREAKAYAARSSAFLLPSGLRTERNIRLLADKMRTLYQELQQHFDVAYCAVGSGTVMKALQRADLARQYYGVDVFHKQPEVGEAHLLTPVMTWQEPAPLQQMPSFASASHYDAKVWQFIVENSHPEGSSILWWAIL